MGVNEWIEANQRRERMWRRTDDPGVFFRGMHRWWAARRRWTLLLSGRPQTAKPETGGA